MGTTNYLENYKRERGSRRPGAHWMDGSDGLRRAFNGRLLERWKTSAGWSWYIIGSVFVGRRGKPDSGGLSWRVTWERASGVILPSRKIE